MSSVFTRREIQYLGRLIERNRSGVSFDPLENPVPGSEEAMRNRLRGKAYHMLLDLIKLDQAGIINYSDMDDEAYRTILLLVNGSDSDVDQKRRRDVLLKL